VCVPCKIRNGLSRQQLRSQKLVLGGVCLRLHGSDEQKQSMREYQGLAEEDGNELKSSRSARVAGRNMANNFVAAPSSNSKLNLERNEASHARALRKKTELLENIKDADLDDRDMQRVFLGALVGKENVNLSRGGTSKSSMNKANVTAGIAANRLIKMLTMKDPSNYTIVQQKLSANALKRAPPARITPPPPQEITANGAAVGATSRARELRPNDENSEHESTSSNPIQRKSLQKQDLPGLCNRFLKVDIAKRKAGKPRRPLLAIFADYKKPEVEQFLGLNISDCEWHKIRIHAKYPGPMVVPIETETFRCRVSDNILLNLLDFINRPDNTQKYAFGETIRTIIGGLSVVHLDKVALIQSVRSTAIKFLTAMEEEVQGMNSDEWEGNESERCGRLEKDTFRRCTCERKHKGNCKFTTKGSLSVTTLTSLVGSLTLDEIKSLAGLDDTKVLQGRDNFIRMRELAESLCTVEEANKLKQKIDASETYHQCYFTSHLQRIGGLSCNCLTCGFHDTKHPDDIVCTCAEHEPSCTECAESFAILETLKAHLEIKQADLTVEQANANEGSLIALHRLDEYEHQIECAFTDLREYRSHLARHKAENDYSEADLEGLVDDAATITSDYKMKILAAFFRMNQKKWFGQRGTSCLGFMIAWNSDEVGKKDVKFVMMVTDDTLQDEWEVACAKKYIYENELPLHIKQVHFRADGAGCFRSRLHRSIQPYWLSWTGIVESSYTLTPAGDGKTGLDGTFGRTGEALKTSCDKGNSYGNAQEILVAFEKSEGVTGTTMLGFLPERSNRFCCELSVSIESVLRTELDPLTGSSRAYKHSGYGSGIPISPPDSFFYHGSKKKSKNADKIELTRDLVTEEILQYLGHGIPDPGPDAVPGDNLLKLAPDIVSAVTQGLASGCKSRSLPLLHLAPNPAMFEVMPFCSSIFTSVNMKESLRGAGLSKPGEGKDTVQQRHKRRVNRAEAKNEKKLLQIETTRKAKKDSGIWLCGAQCPTTQRYCSAEFLTEGGHDIHVAAKKHTLPVGIRAKDKLILLASEAGGVLAAGSRPNRMAGSTKAYKPSEKDASGEHAAICYERYNRKEGVQAYQKPKKLVSTLEELFNREPKLDEYRMREEMSKMIDPVDKGLMFCFSKRGEQPPPGTSKTSKNYRMWAGCQVCKKKPCTCNGMLLSLDQIRGWISARTQKRKKADKSKKRKRSADDDEQNDEQG
jgi:hypothetical protein